MGLEVKVKKFFVAIGSFTVLVIFTVFLIARNVKTQENANTKDHQSKNEYSYSTICSKGDSIKNFAETLLGIPYKYANSSTDGFDCSGFVYYVFSNFKILIPRSSYLIAEVGNEVDSVMARPGDLIFFKGTNLADLKVGHVGIVISAKGDPIEFIHASSGKKKNGVVKTKLSDSNYIERYLMIRRYF